MARNDCERCQGMTRERLCNELAAYRVAIIDIEERTYSSAEEYGRNVAEALESLKEVLKEVEAS